MMMGMLIIITLLAGMILFVLYYSSMSAGGKSGDISFLGYLAFLKRMSKNLIKNIVSIGAAKEKGQDQIKAKQISDLRLQIEKLKNDNEELQSSVKQIEGELSAKVHLLEDIQKKNWEQEQIIENYKSNTAGFIPVDREWISNDICSIIDSMTNAINSARQMAVQIVLSIIESNNETSLNSFQSFMEYIQDCQENDSDDIKRLYYGLTTFSGVFPPFAYDIENTKSNKERRSYLLRQVFEDFIRPQVSDLLLLLEQLRLSAVGTRTEKKAISQINNIIDVCHAYSINVGYKATYDYLEDSDFTNFEIHASDDVNLQTNQIGKVIRYSVNYSESHIQQEKTIIEMKL